MRVLVQRMVCRDRVTHGIVTGRVGATGPVWITVWVESHRPVLEVVPTFYATRADCDATFMHELGARETFGWEPDGPPFEVDVPELEDLDETTVRAWACIPVYSAVLRAEGRRFTIHQAYLDAIDGAVTL